METGLVPLLLVPLKPSLGILFILTGLYSLTFNRKDAKRKNHSRSEKLAQISGWVYIASGAAIMLKTFF